MLRLFRVLGKKGRITIPYEIRQRIGFRYNDVLSFTELDDSSVVVRREKICDNCNELAEEYEENYTLEDFLDSLSEEEQRDALIHLSLLWAEKQNVKTVSDNEKYTFRTWLLRLGLIGDEFKTVRHHLLKNLEGNIAWKDPAQAEKQKERLAQKRAAQLNDTVQNTNENININEPESETATEQNEDSGFVMSM